MPNKKVPSQEMAIPSIQTYFFFMSQESQELQAAAFSFFLHRAQLALLERPKLRAARERIRMAFIGYRLMMIGGVLPHGRIPHM